MSAFSGVTPAYVQGAGKPLQSLPALTLAWDGAATPTLTVTSGGSAGLTVSGQAQAGFAGVPSALLEAVAPTGNPWRGLGTA